AVRVVRGAVGAEGGGRALQLGVGIALRVELARVAREFARPRLVRSSTIIWKPPVWPRPRIGGGTTTNASASWIPASSRLMPETIRSWVRALPRSFQLLYTTKVVEMLGTLAKSRTEKPTMWTQAEIPSGFCRMALTFCATSIDRGWEAPSGRMDTRMA